MYIWKRHTPFCFKHKFFISFVKRKQCLRLLNPIQTLQKYLCLHNVIRSCLLYITFWLSMCTKQFIMLKKYMKSILNRTSNSKYLVAILQLNLNLHLDLRVRVKCMTYRERAHQIVMSCFHFYAMLPSIA